MFVGGASRFDVKQGILGKWHFYSNLCLTLWNVSRHWLFSTSLRNKWFATCHVWGTHSLTYVRDKYLDLFEGQMMWPFWGTHSLTLWGSHGPLGGTNGLTFLRGKYLTFLGNKYLTFFGWQIFDLFERKIACHLWGTNSLPFLRNRWLALLSDKYLAIFERQIAWPCWGTNNVPFLRDKWQGLRRGGLDFHSQ